MRQHAGADHGEARLEPGLRRIAIIDAALALRQNDGCPAMTRQVSGDLPAGLGSHLDGWGKAAHDHEDTPGRLATQPRRARWLSARVVTMLGSLHIISIGCGAKIARVSYRPPARARTTGELGYIGRGAEAPAQARAL